MMNLGRNSPCHCGSGKKYKKCHLNADQASRAELGQEDWPYDSPGPFASVEALSNDVSRLSNRFSATGSVEFSNLQSKTKPLLEYLERREEIERAGEALEAHRSEFESLCDDDKRFHEFNRTVFAEECFLPFRFTASDIRRAVDEAGFSPFGGPDDQTAESLRAAILHVADKERRDSLGMNLLIRMADFVAEGRFLEGWLAQCSALQTMEECEDCNPFLFHMFSYGYDAWFVEDRAQDESLLKDLGLDPRQIKEMSFGEVENCLKDAMSDPARTGKVEAFFERNPDYREATATKLDAMRRKSIDLLDRDDTPFLELTTEELLPWIDAINGLLSQFGLDTNTEASSYSDGRVLETIQEPLFQVLRDMADSIFTQNRIEQLVADLKEFQGERFDAGDRKGAELAAGAVSYVKEEDSPGLNTFLVNLCWRSLSAIAENGVDCRWHVTV